MNKRRGFFASLRRAVARLMLLVLVALPVVGGVAYWRSSNGCAEMRSGTPTHAMKAIIQCDFGAPDVLALQDVEKPVPTDSQVLVRVRAASVNPLDWHYLRGTPYIARLTMGLRKPSEVRVGVDFAGVVEAVGRAVTQFTPGDSVFGGRTGAFAEYVAVRGDRIARMPPNVTFEQAAATPVAAITALQGLRDHGKVGPGQKVLVNGASGGVGTFAVQIAKSLGAEVTGVCSARNVELVRGIGADRVIDYTAEDFTKGGTQYDVIIDNVGNHSLSDLRRVLKPGGRYVMIGGSSGKWLDPMPRVAAAVVTSWFVDQEMTFFISNLNQPDLAALGDLMARGKVTPVIDRTYALGETAAAVAYVETGRARGKVIITIE